MNQLNSFQPFSLYFSAENTQTFLKKTYEQQAISDADTKSFKNCYPFIYYLEHSQIYYSQAKHSPLLIQPVLLFYGLVHLIKACILTIDPNYPENTAMLAHGVSTRKRKKQQYEFFDDEVKFQKNGLFSLMADKMFSLKHLEGEKINMDQLFSFIPELENLFSSLLGKKTFIDVPIKNELIMVPKQILDRFHMSEQRFIDYFQGKSSSTYSNSTNDFLLFRQSDPILHDSLQYNIHSKQHCLSLVRNSSPYLPELLVHYLLLYNLSMIARYETEWWSELIKTMPNKDYPFILSFLQTTAEKGPFLIHQFLSIKRK